MLMKTPRTSAPTAICCDHARREVGCRCRFFQVQTLEARTWHPWSSLLLDVARSLPFLLSLSEHDIFALSLFPLLQWLFIGTCLMLMKTPSTFARFAIYRDHTSRETRCLFRISLAQALKTRTRLAGFSCLLDDVRQVLLPNNFRM
jgi:hypothetical protein